MPFCTIQNLLSHFAACSYRDCAICCRFLILLYNNTYKRSTSCFSPWYFHYVSLLIFNLHQFTSHKFNIGFLKTSEIPSTTKANKQLTWYMYFLFSFRSRCMPNMESIPEKLCFMQWVELLNLLLLLQPSHLFRPNCAIIMCLIGFLFCFCSIFSTLYL